MPSFSTFLGRPRLGFFWTASGPLDRFWRKKWASIATKDALCLIVVSKNFFLKKII